jgi:hypothetical protein
MASKVIRLPLKVRLQEIILRAASAAVRFVLSPATGICVGYLLYPQKGIITYPDNFLVWESTWSLARLIVKDIGFYGGAWVVGAACWVWAVIASSAFIFQIGSSIGDYRSRKLLVAQIQARRQAPVPPSDRLQLPITTPQNMGNDIWDEIMRHFETRQLTKYVF